MKLTYFYIIDYNTVKYSWKATFADSVTWIKFFSCLPQSISYCWPENVNFFDSTVVIILCLLCLFLLLLLSILKVYDIDWDESKALIINIINTTNTVRNYAPLDSERFEVILPQVGFTLNNQKNNVILEKDIKKEVKFVDWSETACMKTTDALLRHLFLFWHLFFCHVGLAESIVS